MTPTTLLLYILAAGAGLFGVFILFLIGVFLWFLLMGITAPRDNA